MAEPQQIPEWSPNPYPNAIPMQQMNAQGDGGYAPQYYPAPQNFGQSPSAVPPQQQPAYAAPQQNNFNADVDKPAPMPSSAAAPEPERPYKAPRKEMPKKKKIAIIVGTIVPTVVVAAVILMIIFLRTELVIIQSANTKQDWMNAMATAFNAKQYRFSDGAMMRVQVNHTGSTFNAGLQPMIYSPAIMTWVDLTNAQWNQNFSANLVDKSKCKPTVSIPIGIAMWKHMAQSLGWPDKQIGWSDIADLARNSSKWSFGEFKYGHGQPESSNSGRLSIVGQIFAFTGQKTQLTVNDVLNPNVRNQVESIQRTVYHYGKIDTDLLDRMAQRGPDYLTAATSYESNVIRWNANYPDLPFPFVLIYPREGTFWNEHPMCVVEGASWSTPKQREAAQKFIDFVLEKEQQEATVQFGIRPANSDFDPSTIPNSPFKESNGVLPVTSETIPSLPYPSDDVTNAIIQLWVDTKKPASILLILDVSGSMQDQNKITYAKQAAASFVNQMHDRDEIYVITFSSSYSFLLPDSQNNTLSVIRGQMATQISLLYPGGGTALFDTTIAGVNFMNNLKAGREGTDQRYNYAVVLMTDGKDTSSRNTFSSMMNALPNGESSDQIHVFTVAYGSDADKDSLQQIASRTNGKAYVASTTNILSIYSDIVLEF